MFQEIIGFASQKKYFSRLIRSGGLSQAYLFSGPGMIGKKRFAVALARAANAVPEGSPMLDLHVVAPDEEDAQGVVSIDKVRELRSFLATTPITGPYKFVVIDDAQAMTDEAANAVLKTLEEPYRSLVWLVVTHQAEAVPATIRSRCQEVRFLAQGDEEVQALPEVRALAAGDRRIVLSLAQGRVGWARRIIAGGQVAHVRQSVAQFEKLPSLSALDRLAYARKLHQKDEIAEVVSWWLAWARTQLHESGSATVAKDLLALTPILRQSQNNHRLAFESFLLRL